MRKGNAMKQYDHAQACIDLGERLTSLGSDLSEPHICNRVSISPDNAARLKACIQEMDELIGEVRDLDRQAQEAAAREYDDYTRQHRLTTRDVL